MAVGKVAVGCVEFVAEDKFICSWWRRCEIAWRGRFGWFLCWEVAGHKGGNGGWFSACVAFLVALGG